MRNRWRDVAAAACAAALAVGLCGCGADAESSGSPGGPTITIGIVDDQPGLAMLRGDRYEGFDIDVAEYVARSLGYAAKQIVYQPVDAVERDDLLNDGGIDLMVGYTGTGEPSARIEYVGTYLDTNHDLLVLGSHAGDITGPDSMDGRVACTARGAGAAATLSEAAPGVSIEERDDYAQCVTALMVGEVDAVAADDAMLDGFAAEHGEGYMTVLGRPYADSWRGIAVKGGDTELAAHAREALAAMIDDGTWGELVARLTADTGFEPGSVPEVTAE